MPICEIRLICGLCCLIFCVTLWEILINIDMKFKRYIIILVAVLCALSGFARATDNRTFNRFYHLSPKEFEDQISYYFHHNLEDSAMLCANVQASKYGKEKLTAEEIQACCSAYRCMGVEYLTHYYNFSECCRVLLESRANCR